MIEDSSKDRKIRHQKIKLSQPQKLPNSTIPPSVSFLASGEALRFAAEKAANFQKLYEHDPIANFFNLDQTSSEIGPHSHPAILTLLNHPCRGCPHLQLGYRPEVLRPKAEESSKPKPLDRRGFTNQNIMDLDIKKLAPEEKVGSVLPTPMCSAQPTSHKDPYTQQIHVTYRETWYRCPLYGIGYVSEHIHNLLNQISSLQGELNTLKQDVKRLAQKP